MSEEIIRLQSTDNQVFDVPRPAAMRSKVVESLLSDTADPNDVIPVQVHSKTLAKVVEYMKFFREDKPKGADGKTMSDKEIKDWEDNFFPVDKSTMQDFYALVNATTYLDIQLLTDWTLRKAASMIKGKTVEELRDLFNIVNDFTPEEEEEVRRPGQWSFE